MIASGVRRRRVSRLWQASSALVLVLIVDRAAHDDDAVDVREQGVGLDVAVAGVEHHQLDGVSGRAERLLDRQSRVEPNRARPSEAETIT
jgi:hypothetical protein